MVEAGQVVGLSGATGRVTGAHLHLAVFVLGAVVDPEPFFDGTFSAEVNEK
jgi:murein DD-endopeptidase MepM/ murein hydrolase activator NlpD